MFDVLVDEMHAHSTEWLVSRRHDVVDQIRRLQTEELAIVRVLDERGQVDCSVGSDGESARTVREKVETARALEGPPAVGAVAVEGGFSSEQLREVVKLADEESDAELAQRAPNVDPAELARMARKAKQVSAEEQRARHEARELRMWWSRDHGMLHLRGQLPDVMGDAFEQTIVKLTELMKPARGEGWDSFEHRAADALAVLCELADGASDDTPSLAARPVLQVHVGRSGPAEIAGVPIADSLLEQLRANASIELVLDDDEGMPITIGKRAPALSPKITRAVLLRDGKCRMPGCARWRGLEAHHLCPRTWGGTDELANLVAVCPMHHRLLVPHRALALIGNPNLPDGLRLVDACDLPPPRAGPRAA